MDPMRKRTLPARTGAAPLPAPVGALDTLIGAFCSELDALPATKETYAKSIRAFLGWVKAQGGRAPTRAAILAYKASLAAARLSTFTVSTRLVAIRQFFAWAETSGYCNDVARGVKGDPKPRTFAKDCLLPEQATALLGAIPRDSLEGQRNFALVNLLLRTGIREIEAVRAHLGDIRQQGPKAVLWVHGKGRASADEFVILTAAALEPIREYLAARGPQPESAALFASLSDRNRGQGLTTRTVRGIVKGFLRKVGLESPRLTTHSLRHSAVTYALMAGATLQEAQAMARHTNITTTTIYAHNLNRLERPAEESIDRILKAGAHG
jgi:integrase/recombinase XerD